MNQACKLDGYWQKLWRRRLSGLVGLFGVVGTTNIAWAHALDRSHGLPAPRWLYALGVALMVIVSVVMSGARVRGVPRDHSLARPVLIGGVQLLSAWLFTIIAVYLAHAVTLQTSVETTTLSTETSSEPLRPVRITMPPGITFERCLTLAPDQALSYWFQAAQPLVFDIHYHDQNEKILRYAIPEHPTHSEERTYSPPAARHYCLTWRNPTSDHVAFSWAFHTKTTIRPNPATNPL